MLEIHRRYVLDDAGEPIAAWDSGMSRLFRDLEYVENVVGAGSPRPVRQGLWRSTPDNVATVDRETIALVKRVA
jgi:hypothetical protein